MNDIETLIAVCSDRPEPELAEGIVWEQGARQGWEWAQSKCADLEKLVYVPGLWKCPKCNFQLVQRSLNALDGTVSTRDQAGDKCPNCNTSLWRVSERELGNEIANRCEEEINENVRLRNRITELELELEDIRDSQPFIAWVKIRDGREHLMCGPVMIALVIFTGTYWITAVGQGIYEDTLYKTIEEAKAAVEKIFVK